ncbi:efflux RND transporter permease subunit [Candidatus Nephthysia bennettiae]|uniref:Efflux RND transporter permease subunit n=1 Tax=Candidatus Nephthysia bennettiae TaxID=3127016 RepID=A0A934KAZ9_9BACT|nr:efflux RND transporter permease subunit [Candidatus Dormibacteraeota bacterium]MBJ7614588.1 efflux RND transporter permease subunit [Candidatus Dormibacteraeota bacterium]
MSVVTRLSLRLGVVVLLGVVLLFGTGVFAATRVQQDLLPDISIPAVIVITPDQGASPQIVDAEVTVPLVNAVQGVSGVDTVQSTSSQGSSLVVVLFKDGTDVKAAQQDVNTAVARARPLLPAQTPASTVQTFSTNSLPLLEYAVSANEPLGELAGQLRAQALPKLKGLAGVSSVVVTGAPTDEVDVTLDPAKLAAHSVSVAQVSAALQQATVVQSVGSLKQGSATIPLQVSGSLTSLDQISNITVAPSAAVPPTGATGAAGATGAPRAAGAPAASGATATAAAAAPAATIAQLGTVQVVSMPADTITRTNGSLSIGIQILKGPDANTVTVSNEVKNTLPGVESTIGHGIHVESIQDQATPITQAIGDILREGLLGAVFAILVIFVFLRSARATVVAAVSIPLSLLVALIVLWWQGITLNILTLGGMMVAIGRVVDDSIVVLENISRHVSEGERPLIAAYTGAREITTAVASSTLTTVTVFLPIALLTGIAGSFFRPFALTVVVALLASLVVAITVVPLLAARLLPAAGAQRADRSQQYSWMQRAYVPVIRWATAHRLIALGVAALIFAGSMALIPLLRVNLLDRSSSPAFPVAITMPDNSTLTETDAETQKVEALIKGVPGVNAYQATVGGLADPFAPPGTVPANPSQAQVLILVGNGQYDTALAAVKRALSGYGGPAKVEVGQAQNSSNASSSQMQVDVRAGNPSTLQAANDAALASLSKVHGITGLKSNLAASKPQYQLVPTAKLAASGLTIQQLALIVAQDVNGQVATQANLPQGAMNVRVQLPSGTADTAGALARLSVPTAAGVVPLSTLATIQEVTGPQSVNRVNGDRDATITGTITGNNTSAVQADVNRALKNAALPAGASTSTGGVFTQLSTVLTQFVVALLAAIGLVYLILVATFRSLLKPLVLLVSIPFAATGAIVALVVTNTSLSLPGLIGILMLTGIVVTNAIVLLDLVEQYRDRGLGLQEALIEGGRHRLRPILMTAFATMLALAPLAVSGGGGGVGGAFISRPLAIVVIGGLFTSTLLTLVLVPVLYSLASRFTGRRSTRDLDEMLDAAEDRRFKPLGVLGPPAERSGPPAGP